MDSLTGLMLELETIFITRAHPCESSKSHENMLRQLAHFNEWCFIQLHLDKKWLYPEARLLNRELPLSDGEIEDYATFCNYSSKDLTTYYRFLTVGDVEPNGPQTLVRKNTKARRLEVVCDYLCWLSREYLYLDKNNSTEENSAFIYQIQSDLKISLTKYGKRQKTSPTTKNITTPELKEILSLLNNKKIFLSNSIGIRNALIIELGLVSGLRAGEILKLKTTDLKLKISHSGSNIAYVYVKRRPNDYNDIRTPEPAVKAGEGPITIPLQVYQKLQNYIKNERRNSVDKSLGRQTEYLFVNHRKDINEGKPLNQRNLNKLFEKINHNYEFSINFTPHTMRHSFFNDLYQKLKKDKIHPNDIKSHIRDAGRWSTGSSMPALYTDDARKEELYLLTAKREDEMMSQLGDIL